MGAREAFAAIAIPILAAAIWWLPAFVFLILLGIIVVMAADEMVTMARGAGMAVGRWLPHLLLVGLLASSWSFGLRGMALASIVVVLTLVTAQLAHPRAPDGALAGAQQRPGDGPPGWDGHAGERIAAVLAAL